MLATDPQKLRWLGIDLRPRGRRRVAVVANYAAFAMVVWVYPHAGQAAYPMLFALCILDIIWPSGKNARAVASVCAAFFLLTMAWLAVAYLMRHGWRTHPPASASDVWSPGFVIIFGILWKNGIVESGSSGTIARLIAKGQSLSWRQQRRLARMGYCVGRDGFAWFEYGVRFKKLAETQQAEIAAMSEASPQGKWMPYYERKLIDDERIHQEDARLRAAVQRIMTWILMGTAFTWLLVADHYPEVSREMVTAWVWTVVGLEFTLRQAIVLWTEPDPRQTSELHLAEGEA